MDLDAYVAERRGEWARLAALSSRRRLSAHEADELVLLYRRAATHLSRVRSANPDPVLLTDLSRLVAGARAAITRDPRFSWRPLRHFVTDVLPGELYRTRAWWSGVAAACVLLTALLVPYFTAHPEAVRQFLSDADIAYLVETGFVSYYSENNAPTFAAQVWTNNALVTAQCLAAGVLIVPVVYLLATNLLNLALTGAVMTDAGRADVFWTMLAPHGLLELTCVFVGAGVGLRIGWAWVAPGPRHTRVQALAARARSGMVVALGLAGVLGVAGLLEAFVTPSPLPPAVRVALGALAWLAFLAYALVAGAAADRRGASADLAEHRALELPTA